MKRLHPVLILLGCILLIGGVNAYYLPGWNGPQVPSGSNGCDGNATRLCMTVPEQFPILCITGQNRLFRQNEGVLVIDDST